eukprot:scaffold103432_cov22-Prasinocladus_malaysianus.AAC.1
MRLILAAAPRQQGQTTSAEVGQQCLRPHTRSVSVCYIILSWQGCWPPYERSGGGGRACLP